MEDMTPFERRLATELGRMAGPGRDVDGMAMVRAITARPDEGRFRSMFSATKLALAGVVTAALGALLVIGVAPAPQRELTPVAASPSPSSQASLPGLVTEVVEPGVLRIVRDDAGHDLDARHPDFRLDLDGLTIGSDGTIWIISSAHGSDNEADQAGPPFWALGRPDVEVPVALELGYPVPLPDGSILFVGRSITHFDGTTLATDSGSAIRPVHGGTLWLIEPDRLMALADDPTSGPRPPDRLAAIWTDQGWVRPSELGRMASSRGHTCLADGLGVTCYGNEGPLGYLVGTPINEVATAPDGSIWAVGGFEGEGGGLYRITLP